MNGQMSNFVTPDDYKQRFEQLLDNEHDLSLAVAFWGEGAVKLISSRPSKHFRILCNLMSGGTNPYVIRELCELAESSGGRIQIRQCDRLHAKVVVGKRQALIGSANVSGNGLGLGDQGSAHWLEAGVLTSEESVVGALVIGSISFGSRMACGGSSMPTSRQLSRFGRKTVVAGSFLVTRRMSSICVAFHLEILRGCRRTSFCIALE